MTYYLQATAYDLADNSNYDYYYDGDGNDYFYVDNTAPTVTKLSNGSADVILSTGVTYLSFGEALSEDSQTVVQNVLTAGADKTLTYDWSGATLTIHATETTTFANDVVVNISDVAGNTTNSALLVDSKLDSTQTTPDGSGDATSNSSTPNVVITNPTQPVDITIDPGTTDPTIDVSSFVDNGTGDIPQITITSTAGSGNAAAATIEIPATTVTGPSSWDGIIAAPTVTTVTLPSGSTLGEAIEIGYAAGKLTFDNAVRILLPNQAGKKVGYSRPGTAFTEITNVCAADNQATGDALPVDGDCKIDVGSDLVIWTKHFTKFASYTQTTSSSGNSGSTGSDGGDGLSDGLGCASRDCSAHPVAVAATPQSRALASAINFTEEVLGAQSTDEIAAEASPSPEVLGQENPSPAPQAESKTGMLGNNNTRNVILLLIAAGLGFLVYRRMRKSSSK